ncbi:protein TIME FOR COFFEE-like isoform X1 [Nymphaea colorata]|nr:protein TIME FOR COFFEE-like isoform X1 [Nymphaea colorata]
MDRNREVRRGQPMANGLSRRRPQRTGGSGMRDSPEEAVAGEMQETAAVRLRDRKKDRLSRSKRRRGERLHGNREEGGEESSEESVDVEEEDDDEDEDSSAADHRRSIPPPAAKIVKPPWKVPDEMIGVPVPRKARSASVKRSHESSGSGGGGGGEQIPTLRQCSTSPATPSAASVSPPSNAPIRRRVKPIGAKQRPAKVPKVSIQEEIEIEVAEVLFGLRQYPAPAVNPELAGNPSSLKMEDREEESPALLGKPRASSPISPQQSVGVQPKVSSSMAAGSPSAGLPSAPKRKRPRPVKSEEEKAGVGSGAVSTVLASFVVKDEAEKMEVSSPRGDKNSFAVVPNGVDGARSIKLETNQEAKKAHLIPDEKPSSAEGPAEEKVVLDVICCEKSEPQVETTGSVKPDVSLEDATKGVSSCLSTCDSQKEEKFKFDLMAPPARSMVDGDINGDSTSEIQALNVKEEISVVELKEKAGEKVEQDVPPNDSEPEKRAEICGAGEQAKQNKDRIFDLRMDEEKSDREGGKQQGHKHSKVARVDMKAPEVPAQWEKSAPHSSSTAPAMAGPSPMPHMTIAGWPGGLPPLGYIGQAPASWPGAPPVQAVVSMEGNTGAPTLQPHILLPHQRYKRCATHCYIAKMVNYLQHVARMNPFWAAASNASLFGAKPYNLNAMPSTEGMILGGPLPGAFPAANFTASGRTGGPTHEKGNGSAATFGGQVPKEKATAQIADGQRKQQTTVQQPPLTPSATNIPHGPAIIFPLNQVAAAVRPGGSKAPVTGHAAGPSAAQVGGVMGSSGAAATVSYNYPNLPTNEAQYIAMVQSSGYPFQIPAHVGAAAAASAYRGSSAHLGQATAAPPPQFFTGSFYASQMLHPSQIQQTQSQALQQGQQNPSTSSGSSSSHKHPQQQRLQGCGGSNSNNYKQQQQLQQESQQQTPQRTRQSPANSVHPNHHLNASHPRQSEAGHPAESDSPSAADSKVSPNFLTQTNHHPTLSSSYGISPLPVPIHHAQNFSIMSSLGSAKNGEKPHLQPQSSDSHPQYGLKGMELVPSQAFAMSFPPGIDFSMAQGHHAIFQNLPEHYRQSYQLAAAQAVAAAASAHQQHVQRTSKQKIGNDSKNAGDHNIGGAVSQEERTAGGAKATPSVASQTLTFSRQPENNNENASISILSSSSPHVSSPAILENQSRSLNLVSAPANGTRVSCPASISSTNIQQSQQQTQLMARSKSSTSNASVPTVSLPTATAISYTDRLPVNMFPGGLSAFPQALMQGTTPQASPQWKSATAAVPSTRTMGSASASSPTKQPKGPVTGPGGSPAHSQISFASTGVNAKVTAMPMGGHMPHGLPNSSLSSSVSNAAPVRLNSSTPIIGSPPQSVAKTSGSPSTRTAPATKGGVLPAPVPAASQPPKNSHTSSTRKSSPPLGGRNNLPAILGHPQLVQSSSPKQSQQQQQPVQSLNLKSQQQSHQQLNKAQYQPAQMFFSKNYLAPQSSQASQLAAAGYYPKPSSSVQPSISNLPQRRPSSEQSQNSPSVSSNSAATGALSLGGSSLSLTTSASESLKSGCASNATARGAVWVSCTHTSSPLP